MLVLISWVAVVFGITGLWLAGTRNFGWLITAQGSALWALYAVFTGQPALFCISFLWWVTESRNYILGRRRANNIH